MHEFMYNTIRRIFNVATYGFLNMEVIGEENIPEKGPFIVACNHASNFDPPLLGTAMRHHLIHFMAKEELFRNPVMAGSCVTSIPSRSTAAASTARRSWNPLRS